MPPHNLSPSPSEDDDTLPAIHNTKRGSEDQGQGNVLRRVSLLERTRLSMAAASQAPQPLKSRKSLKIKRESLFPVNQFETPGKPRALPEAKRDATPTEKLFSEEAEYDSVFKSRPRVALSPVAFTPEVGDGGSDVSALSEGLEGDDEEVGEEEGSRSPLVGRRRLVAG